ncbi:MAG: hypothetical protein E7171_07700 [Firmicutes bacterium]|nr:hypothetical protein [Bacillota bacterium]
MNYNYDLETFITTINNFEKELEKNKESNEKIIRAIKDTKAALDSVKDLNQNEFNIYSQILFASLGCSYISKNN